jgi:hypothetical protein
MKTTHLPSSARRRAVCPQRRDQPRLGLARLGPAGEQGNAQVHHSECCADPRVGNGERDKLPALDRVNKGAKRRQQHVIRCCGDQAHHVRRLAADVDQWPFRVVLLSHFQKTIGD